MDICLRYLMVISLPSLLILGCSPNLLTIRPLRKQSVCFSLNFFILLVITSTLTDSSTIYSSPDSLQNYISIKSYAYIYLLATFWVGVSKLICLNLNYYIVGGGFPPNALTMLSISVNKMYLFISFAPNLRFLL